MICKYLLALLFAYLFKSDVRAIFLSGFPEGLFSQALDEEEKVSEDAEMINDEEFYDWEKENEISISKVANQISEEIKLIGRLAAGIRKIKNNDGGWYFCGELLAENKMIEISTVIAYQTVSNSKSIGLENVSPCGLS